MTQLVAAGWPVCRARVFKRKKEVPSALGALCGAQVSAGSRGKSEPGQLLLMLGCGSLSGGTENQTLLGLLRPSSPEFQVTSASHPLSTAAFPISKMGGYT